MLRNDPSRSFFIDQGNDLDLAPPYHRVVDHFFSCLPTPSLPKSVNKAIYECFTQVSPADTMFSQITIMPWVFWPMYRKVFKEVQFNLVVANFPPAGAYHCRGLKDNYFIPGK